MRLTPLTPETMTDAQRAVYDATIAGKRGRIVPPVAAWLHSPGLAGPAQRMGEFVRFETSLPPALVEMAILIVARHWSARYEWFAHSALARQAGLPEDVIQAILHRRSPVLPDPAARSIHEFATVLLSTRFVPRALHDAVVASFGERGVVELVGILGYYGLVSMTLNAFEVALPDNADCDLDSVP